MITVKDIKNMWKMYKLKPCVQICRWGWATDFPKVGVSIVSHMGSIEVYTFDDNEQGNARASMYAKDISHLTGIPVKDRR